jgi:hypothetical protein
MSFPVKRVLQSIAIYTVLLALVSVGIVYVVTASGLWMIGTTFLGVLFVVLGGATAGSVSPAGAEQAEEAMVDSAGSGGPFEVGGFNTSLRSVLLFYGAGLTLWSVCVLAFFRGTLS